MEIFDCHVHSFNDTPNPKKLIEKLNEAGITGCSVFSNRPTAESKDVGTDFNTRLNEILSWTKGYEGKLFPVLWVHPDEENILQNIQTAVDNGVSAFKVICNNFYVGETKSMDMLSKIASLNKPVFFHSGILWDGKASSNYNRPANWEALLELDGLKFSLGHCSWPWIDECIALYGKFLNALSCGKTTEMFLDLTPGTPEIYRDELFKKIFCVGYDVPNNVLYGTDGSVANYQSAWTKKWLDIDTVLFDKYDIPPKMRQKIFKDNFFRFLGITNDKVQRFVPLPDSQTIWTPKLEK